MEVRVGPFFLLAALTGCRIGDEASSDAKSSTDARVTADPGKISVVVAQGAIGRTTVSCDDGKTWIRDRSWLTEASDIVCGTSTPVRCNVTPCTLRIQDGTCLTRPLCDCVHDPGVPKGIAFGNGSFVSIFGLGAAGRAIRTTDALNWTTVYDVPYSTFGGVRFGSGTFVMASETLNVPGLPTYSLSSVDGTAWKRDGIAIHTRALAYYGYDAGRFLIMHESGLRYTTDAGKTWVEPADYEIDCATDMAWGGGGVYGNGILLTLSNTGHVCRSSDGGATWTRDKVAGYISSNGIFAADQFIFWTNHNDRSGTGDDGFYRYTSSDGKNWTRTKMVSRVSVGPVVQTPSGQFVTANGFFGGYEAQKFFTSGDGLTWTESSQTAPVGDRHFISGLAVGVVDRTPGCGM